MNTKQIDYCIELAHTLNFSRAAGCPAPPGFLRQDRLLQQVRKDSPVYSVRTGMITAEALLLLSAS